MALHNESSRCFTTSDQTAIPADVVAFLAGQLLQITTKLSSGKTAPRALPISTLCPQTAGSLKLLLSVLPDFVRLTLGRRSSAQIGGSHKK